MVSHINTVVKAMDPVHRHADTLKDPQKLLIGGGIASFSLHGYIWGIVAIGGTFLALYLRPLFGLSVPKSNDSVC